MKFTVAAALLAISVFHCHAADPADADANRDKFDLTADDTSTEIPGVVEAIGNVRIKHFATKIQADHAVYDRKARTITLLGNVKFDDGIRTLSGVKAIYRLDNRALHAEGPSKATLKHVAPAPR